MGKQRPMQGKEAFLRMNFLYRAAHTVMATIPSSSNLVSHLGRCMVKIGKKNVLRIEQNIKRTLCKGCSSVLIPGVSATFRRRRKNRRQRIVVTCLLCRTVKRFPVQTARKKQIPSPKTNDESA